MSASFAIAPRFHLDGAWAERLRIAEGDGWRAPSEAELEELVCDGSDPGAVRCGRLFALPAHLRRRFWDMLETQSATGTGDFIGFAGDLAELLAFKELPPPPNGLIDLVVQDVGGTLDVSGLWALVNFGETEALLRWPGLQLRLAPGEGCLPAERSLAGVEPPRDEEPNVLVVIRQRA